MRKRICGYIVLGTYNIGEEAFVPLRFSERGSCFDYPINDANATFFKVRAEVNKAIRLDRQSVNSAGCNMGGLKFKVLPLYEFKAENKPKDLPGQQQIPFEEAIHESR